MDQGDASGKGGHDGAVSFEELLRTLHPLASEDEYAVMLACVAPPEPVAVPVATDLLGDVQRAEIRAIFRMYDTDDSGRLSFSEWAAATTRCGLDEREARQGFDALATECGGPKGGGECDRAIGFHAF